MRGMQEWVAHNITTSSSKQQDIVVVDDFLNSVNMSTIGLRVLLDQHRYILSILKKKDSDILGPVSTKSSVVNIVNIACSDVSALCTEKYGQSPNVTISGDEKLEMARTTYRFFN